MVDAISHASTHTNRVSAWRRTQHAVAPALLAGVATIVVAEWAWWLHRGGVLEGAVPAAAGVLLAALLLLAPARWPAPIVVAAVAVGAVAARHHAPLELSLGRAAGTVTAAVCTALLLRWYAGGAFALTSVRELGTLLVAAILGGVAAAMIQTGALAIADHGDAAALGRIAWAAAVGITLGLVLVASVALTTARRDPFPWRPRRRGEALALVAAVVVAIVALTQWDDPMAYLTSVILVGAAWRFGPRGVAWSGCALVAAADWSAARRTGPFTALADAHTATRLLQVFVGATFLVVLALAFALEERDNADHARSLSTERFRRTFHDSPIAMAVTTLDGQIVETNRALCQLLVRADHRLVGTTLRALRPDDTGEHDLRRASGAPTDTPEPLETRLVDGRGNIVWVEISEAPLRRHDGPVELQVVVLRDVTERKALRQQLFQAQKMESVGRLAGGIAHDFNNVLAVMRGQVELLQDDLDVLDSARARIDSVQRATDRAAALTDDLMAFSRQRVDELVPFDLHELLLGVRELLHQVLGAGVTLDLVLDASPPTIVADPNRIEQAVLNLVVNARDAMPSGGCVTISTRTQLTPTPALVLAVADTGAGMDAKTRARIFEPFFTTKPPGFGTGLGLSTTDDIVRGAGGSINVDSRRGHGTTFILTFPAIAEEEASPEHLIDLTDGPTDSPTVLVVDDESDVRALIAEILRSSGYRVVAAADGDAAIALLERASYAFDLLVTDVVMPVMSGTDLAARVTTQSPSTRVLFISGFVPAGSAALRGAPLIAKPLRRAELLDAVHTALDGAA